MRSCTVPPAAVARPRVVEPIALGTEAQLDRLMDDEVRAAVLDAIPRRKWRSLMKIEDRVPHRWRWRTAEILAQLVAAGRALHRAGAVDRWRQA